MERSRLAPPLRHHLGIVAALATIVLKGGAYLVTGSVGLLSDALESLVNLAAAIVAFIALSAAARPEDEDHRYGHSKAEYFSSGFEGALIMLAAASILYTSVGRLLAPAADRAGRSWASVSPSLAALDQSRRRPDPASGPAAATSPSRSRPTPIT